MLNGFPISIFLYYSIFPSFILFYLRNKACYVWLILYYWTFISNIILMKILPTYAILYLFQVFDYKYKLIF